MHFKKAIRAIVNYATLPPQIDYCKPWKQKSMYAEEYLESLPKRLQEIAYQEIEKQIAAYYTPDESGFCLAYLDGKF